MNILQLENEQFRNLIQESVRKVIKEEVGQIASSKSSPTDRFLNVREAAEMLHLTVPTIYAKVRRREIPHMKKGKQLYFSLEELVEYVKEGRVETNREIESNPERYLKGKGGR